VHASDVRHGSEWVVNLPEVLSADKKKLGKRKIYRHFFRTSSEKLGDILCR